MGHSEERIFWETFAAEWSLDPRELDCLVKSLLLLAVLAECHDAVELLVVLTAGLTAELVHLILKTQTFSMLLMRKK